MSSRYLLLLCGLWLITALPWDQARAEEAALTPHEQGRKIYNFRCYYCHGYSGNARTLTSSFLDPRPRDFTQLAPDEISRESMLESVRNGRPGTGMAAFKGIITEKEIALVVDFVRREFIEQRKENTRYHTLANGWPDHQRYRIAFPFATGDIPLDTPWEALTPSQRKGKRLFLSACISCHDRSRVLDEGPIWEPSAVSYPRNNTSFTPPDSISAASVYAKHDRPPQLQNLSSKEKQGEILYQQNCAFCHAADGSGRNWIGSFLEPHPRDLTDSRIMAAMTPQRLRQAIRDGLPDTTMPAWKNVLSEKEIDAIVAYIDRAFHPLARNANRDE